MQVGIYGPQCRVQMSRQRREVPINLEKRQYKGNRKEPQNTEIKADSPVTNVMTQMSVHIFQTIRAANMATDAKKPACMFIPWGAPLVPVGVVLVSEEVVVAAWLEVGVMTGLVKVLADDCEELDEEVVDPLEEEAAVMLNWLDWAKRVSRSSLSLARLTWKPSPVGQPPLGGLQMIRPRVPSTRASRTWSLRGMTARFWLVNTTVKLAGSVSTRCQTK